MEEREASHFRETEFGSGGHWSDRHEETRQVYRKVARIVAKIWFRWALKWQARENGSSVQEGCKNCCQSESSPRQSTYFPCQVTPASTWISFDYPADEGNKFSRNVGTNALSYTIQELRLSSMSNTCLIGCGYFLGVNYKSIRGTEQSAQTRSGLC
jgi:hypothetical protein